MVNPVPSSTWESCFAWFSHMTRGKKIYKNGYGVFLPSTHESNLFSVDILSLFLSGWGGFAIEKFYLWKQQWPGFSSKAIKYKKRFMNVLYGKIMDVNVLKQQ